MPSAHQPAACSMHLLLPEERLQEMRQFLQHLQNRHYQTRSRDLHRSHPPPRKGTWDRRDHQLTQEGLRTCSTTHCLTSG